MSNGLEYQPSKLAAYLGRPAHASPALNTRPLIGVLEGTGIGSQIIGSALQVLASVTQVTGIDFEIRRGTLIGEDALTHFGQWLPDEVVDFCSEVFRLDGAILSGPGGGRYVYDLRRRFDLFSKFVPIRPWPELAGAGRMVPRYLEGVDILLVRDNVGGVYQGEGSERITGRGKVAEHSFSYSEWEIQRIVEVAARAAADRRGGLHIIVKDGGIPGMSALWREVGAAAARKHGIEAAFMNVDLVAYELIQNAARFDVIVAPNLFGDILADIAGVLVSSRGITFSGNFNAEGHGVFQTNHGSANDLAGTDTANPAGQILSLAMLLRESFGLQRAAAIIETSLTEVWRQGFRTADLAEPGCQILGTRAITERFVQQILRSSEVKAPHETCATAG
jgi:3-isopropylmalate dehydrogenase